MSTPLRTRFAPSPTGDLHVGTAHTGLFNWLFTRHHHGTVVLRIEDTDRKRLVERSLGGIPEAIEWLGIDWDEGPGVGGSYGPYFQSERKEIYLQYANQLLERGHAYYCFCSPERLEEVRRQRANLPTKYDRHCRDLTPDEVAAKRAEGITPTIRFKMPLTGKVTIHDVIRGEITFDVQTLEDYILIKSDGFALYHFANVVDDHLMQITDILRGEDWIPSAPLHHLIYQALGWEMPRLAHTMLLLGPDRKKLSKRHGATSLLQFRDEGILPEALLNYLAIIGWSWDDQQEIFSKDELIEKFDLDRVKAASAIFDHQKLEWMNGYYINHILSVTDLATRALPFLQRTGLVGDELIPETESFGYVKDVVALEKERVKRLTELPEATRYFFDDTLDYTADLLAPPRQKLTPATALAALRGARQALDGVDVADEAATEEQLTTVATSLGLKRGQLFMAVRGAISGRSATPPLFATMRVLGQERCTTRLDAAIAWLEAGHPD